MANGSRAPWAVSLLVLLAAGTHGAHAQADAAALTAAADADDALPPVDDYLAPVTEFRSFKAASTAVAADLARSPSEDAAARYQKSVRNPVVKVGRRRRGAAPRGAWPARLHAGSPGSSAAAATARDATWMRPPRPAPPRPAPRAPRPAPRALPRAPRAARRAPRRQMTKAGRAALRKNLAALAAQNAAAKKLKRVVNRFTEMPAAERAAFLGLVPPGAAGGAALAAARARHLEATSRVSVAAMETHAEATFRAPAVLAEVAEVEAAAAGLATAAAAADPAAAARLRAALRPAALKGIPDWTSVLPSPKDQGACNSCWASASIALTEAASFRRKRAVVSLSEKELVDCATDTFPGGCKGGFYNGAFDYLISKGVALSSLYPYVAAQSSCPAASLTSMSRLASYTALPSGDEAAMLEALKRGPIASAICMDFAFFRYWLVRNSWGTSWGEVRLRINARGEAQQRRAPRTLCRARAA
ncbi:Macrodontain-1 [Scenedesmus sp. PABB004]|nr:Macrodontain-1 [Scenedesmus sp. PABB004]